MGFQKITGDQYNQLVTDRNAVADELKKGGDAHAAVDNYITDASKAYDPKTVLAFVKDGLDGDLKNMKIDPKLIGKVDQHFVDISKEPGAGKWSDTSSLKKAADLIGQNAMPDQPDEG